MCPFCQAKVKNLSSHFKHCDKHSKSIAVEAQRGWALHNICGKVLVLNIMDGLCLFESESGRYVSPATNFKFGVVGETISFLEEAQLSDDEIDTIINMLRLKRKEFGSLPEYPELWRGCEVEIQAGDNIHRATIVKFLSPGYMVTLETGLEISVQPRHIIRIL